MEMPQTFMRIIRNLSLEDLKELREWNRQDSGFNRHANREIDREINQREQAQLALLQGVWSGATITA